ncbi:MAG TPA: alpha/beta hydrolase [Armatimonadota bacterium]|nr:alpha/beta hydrolase [Armatimonadota bacterium]
MVEKIELWRDGAPGAVGREELDVPTLTFYETAADSIGASVVVCPGGGYGALAPHEGEPVARWLNSVGVAAAVLKYRLGPRYRHPAMLQDASRAIRLLRSGVVGTDLDPRRIGILGFSAGGHLASTAATHFDMGDPSASDAADRVSSRPDAAILIYPVITLAGPFAHSGTRQNLLGPNPDESLVESLSNEKQVTPGTPPTFLVCSDADVGVPCENSLYFALALRRVGVPVELHLFERGPHGFGLGGDDPALGSWPARCADWLRSRGWLA